MRTENRIPLPGSEREPVEGFSSAGPADPNDVIQAAVVLRSETPINKSALAARAATPPSQRTPVKREEIEQQYAATADAIAKVMEFARTYELEVVRVDKVSRQVVLSGTVAAFSAAFGVELRRVELGGVPYRVRTGPIYVPASLQPVVAAVLGLDNRPQARIA